MRAVIQRVTFAKVEVEGTVRGEIGPGVLVLLGVSRTETGADAELVPGKVAPFRIFRDPPGTITPSLQHPAAPTLPGAAASHGRPRPARAPPSWSAGLPGSNLSRSDKPPPWRSDRRR